MTASPQHQNARLAVAEEILALMGRRRTSQTALAEHLGLSQPSLSKRLAGRQAFSLDELLAVAAYFDVEVTALFVGIVQGGSSLPWITTGAGEDGDAVLDIPGQQTLDALAA